MSTALLGRGAATAPTTLLTTPLLFSSTPLLYTSALSFSSSLNASMLAMTPMTAARSSPFLECQSSRTFFMRTLSMTSSWLTWRRAIASSRLRLSLTFSALIESSRASFFSILSVMILMSPLWAAARSAFSDSCSSPKADIFAFHASCSAARLSSLPLSIMPSSASLSSLRLSIAACNPPPASLASSSSFLAMSRSALVAMSLRENSVALASAEDLSASTSSLALCSFSRAFFSAATSSCRSVLAEVARLRFSMAPSLSPLSLASASYLPLMTSSSLFASSADLTASSLSLASLLTAVRRDSYKFLRRSTSTCLSWPAFSALARAAADSDVIRDTRMSSEDAREDFSSSCLAAASRSNRSSS
mmetsp:Transcript_27225/g.54365  ORF Transcript_27225/g.54365 Transcript_27225/m.54365 type:complete len:362 (+) Transcript_27225:182-1267(+)